MNTELALVGGGLANALIAHRILSEDPDFPLVVIERGESLGADHTWSFHDSDLTSGQRDWMRPLVVHRWTRHELRFPKRHRAIESGYNSVTSTRLHEVVAGALGTRLRLGEEVEEVVPDRVRLGDGTVFHARAVVDGRGHAGGRHLDVGYQKFVGLFVRTDHPHGLTGPILMDATVEQRDGYRFVYSLPFSDRELLIEDTYYSDDPGLDHESLRAGILAYAEGHRWSIAEVTGTEHGVLPIVLGGDIDGFWSDGPARVARSGMRAALFHQTTGYSLPEAVGLADRIAKRRGAGGSELFELTRGISLELWERFAFFRFLNRMLFRAAEPDRRYRVFERFYGLREGLIARFYAGRLEWPDKVRLLSGRPPVPVHRALRCLFNGRHRVAGAAAGAGEEVL